MKNMMKYVMFWKKNSHGVLVVGANKEKYMIVQYEGYELIVDPETDFIMLRSCYDNGCNCYNCSEAILEGCIIDELPYDLIMEKAKGEIE